MSDTPEDFAPYYVENTGDTDCVSRDVRQGHRFQTLSFSSGCSYSAGSVMAQLNIEGQRSADDSQAGGVVIR